MSLSIQLLRGHPMLYQTFLLLPLRVLKSLPVSLHLRGKWWLQLKKDQVQGKASV